jgi:hypothetical protein
MRVRVLVRFSAGVRARASSGARARVPALSSGRVAASGQHSRQVQVGLEDVAHGCVVKRRGRENRAMSSNGRGLDLSQER